MQYTVLSAGEYLSRNSYPGRGVLLGVTPDGKSAVCAYFIMGRSENSRNRIFKKRGDDLFTEPFDVRKVDDPSLILYRALGTCENDLVVTNGDQTDTVLSFLESGKSFEEALTGRTFEPDAPNFTPRISGIFSFDGEKSTYKLSILKSLDENGSACARYFYNYPAKRGLAHLIHTYESDGNPLPTFCDEPRRLATENDIDVFAKALWDTLNKENRISLYVRYTALCGRTYTERIINKHQTEAE